MRIYTLQIHTTNQSEEFDKVYHFSEFDNLCREFKKQVAKMECAGAEMSEKIEPNKGDGGEVTGGYKFANADGSFVIGRAYDYDILDDDY